MNTDRDFDRISRAWLDLMPDEAPDRVTAAVLQAVETTPQVGRPLAAIRRSFRMNRYSFAAVAVVAIAVVGGGLLVSRLATPSVGGPSPSPLVSPTASPSPVTGSPLPAELSGAWLGAHRDLAGVGDESGLALHVSDQGLGISPPNLQSVRILAAEGSMTADRQIRVTTPPADRICGSGDSGTYTWTLSPSGQTLTLTAVADACAARAQAFSGFWWLDDCKRSPCFGTIDAGTYGSEYFDPRLGSRTWSPRFGALTFTVPDGWATATDLPNVFSITPSADFARETVNGPDPGAIREVDVFAALRPPAQGAGCDAKPDDKAPHSVADLVASLKHDRALVVDQQPNTTIGGLPAIVLDVKLAASWTVQCPDAGTFAAYFAGSFGAGSGTSEYTLGVATGERQRLMLVDLGQGDIVAIVVDSSSSARFTELIDAATPIIDSFRFK
jgi:hypothetical protein